MPIFVQKFLNTAVHFSTAIMQQVADDAFFAATGGTNQFLAFVEQLVGGSFYTAFNNEVDAGSVANSAMNIDKIIADISSNADTTATVIQVHVDGVDQGTPLTISALATGHFEQNVNVAVSAGQRVTLRTNNGGDVTNRPVATNIAAAFRRAIA